MTVDFVFFSLLWINPKEEISVVKYPVLRVYLLSSVNILTMLKILHILIIFTMVSLLLGQLFKCPFCSTSHTQVNWLICIWQIGVPNHMHDHSLVVFVLRPDRHWQAKEIRWIYVKAVYDNTLSYASQVFTFTVVRWICGTDQRRVSCKEY